jgi:DNA-binding HxlR family transcriptional regulator
LELSTRIRSRLKRMLASRRLQTLRQAAVRARRRIAGHPPRIHYFHEITHRAGAGPGIALPEAA